MTQYTIATVLKYLVPVIESTLWTWFFELKILVQMKLFW
jgi:hypothetical protein